MATIDELREAFRRVADDEENMRRNDPAGLQAICPHHFRNDVCVWCEKERVMSEMDGRLLEHSQEKVEP